MRTIRDQLKLLGIVAIPVLIVLTIWGVVSAQTDSLTLATCPERSSTYQDGVLIYQCEIVERAGVYSVVESDSKGIIRERPATQMEVSTYLAITQERECLANKRVAKDVLSTPIAVNADLNVLTARIAAIEDAIKECA